MTSRIAQHSYTMTGIIHPPLPRRLACAPKAALCAQSQRFVRQPSTLCDPLHAPTPCMLDPLPTPHRQRPTLCTSLRPAPRSARGFAQCVCSRCDAHTLQMQAQRDPCVPHSRPLRRSHSAGLLSTTTIALMLSQPLPMPCVCVARQWSHICEQILLGSMPWLSRVSTNLRDLRATALSILLSTCRVRMRSRRRPRTAITSCERSCVEDCAQRKACECIVPDARTFDPDTRSA